MRTRCTFQVEEFIRVRFYRERCLPLRVLGESAPTIPVAAVSQASRNFFLAFSSPLVDPSFFLEFLLSLSRPNFSFFFHANKMKKSSNRPACFEQWNSSKLPTFFSSRAFPTLSPISSPLARDQTCCYHAVCNHGCLRDSRLISRDK